MALQRLKEAAEKAKIELSSVTAYQRQPALHHGGRNGPNHLDITITRAKFNELTADLVDPDARSRPCSRL